MPPKIDEVSCLPHSTSFTSFATSSIPGVPALLDEFEDPEHDRPARQTTAEDQAAQRHEAGHRIDPLPQPKVWIAMATPPMPVTTVLIIPTAHSRVERGGVVKFSGVCPNPEIAFVVGI